jgi:hypothetical protein
MNLVQDFTYFIKNESKKVFIMKITIDPLSDYFFIGANVLDSDDVYSTTKAAVFAFKYD